VAADGKITYAAIADIDPALASALLARGLSRGKGR